MKAEVVETDNEIVYRVTGSSESERSILLSSFFSEENEVLTKKFLKSTLMFGHDLSVAAIRFEKHIKEQGNTDERTYRFEKALDWICRRHKEKSINWWLAGSGALFARGIDVVPHDIDVMTYKSEIDKIVIIVKDDVVEPFHHVSGWVVRGFGVINHDFRIDYAFEPEDWVDGDGPVDFGPTARNELEEIRWRDHVILVPKVHFHIKSNQARNRKDVVEKIEKYMKERNLTLFST